MRQMLLSLLSKERRKAVMPYVTTARVGEGIITVETPEKEPMTVSPLLAGELLAHDIIALLCEEATPGVSRPPFVPFAWLCLAEDGLGNPSVGTALESAELTFASQWAIQTPRRTRSKMLRSIRRTNPPAVVILSGEKTPTSNAVAHQMAEAFVRQHMVSSYATQSIVMDLRDNPRWLQDEQQYNPYALRRLEQLVVRDVAEGNYQSHAVLVFDDKKPQPIEETVDVVLALTCMSQETQRHPALQSPLNNLFTVVAERG